MEGRQRRSFTATISGRRSILWLRVAARSDLWPGSLACAIRCCADGWGQRGARLEPTAAARADSEFAENDTGNGPATSVLHLSTATEIEPTTDRRGHFAQRP